MALVANEYPVEHLHISINKIMYQFLDGFSVQFYRETCRIASNKITVSFRTLSHFKERLLKIKAETEGINGDRAYIEEITDVHFGVLNGTIISGNKIHSTKCFGGLFWRM
ncbi:MAG: hypothetical protein LBD29_08125 [Treponema sp.]|jgi:hypothetical protein|nr:hypothetical protein [Treponema sp.]